MKGSKSVKLYNLQPYFQNVKLYAIDQ